MNEEDKLLYIANRLERSDKALQEVSVLAEMQHYNTAISRLYYSLFYVVSAYLAKNDLVSKTHAGALHHFNKEIVKPGKIDKSYAKSYAKAFQMRQVGDYGDLEEFTLEDLNAIQPAIIELIKQVKQLIVSTD